MKAKRLKLITNLRTGSWTPAEDAIVMREDINTVEMMVILQRTESSIHIRRSLLCNGETKLCAHCGKSFVTTPAWRRHPNRPAQVFCSIACGREAHRVCPTTMKCLVCGGTFKPSRSSRKVCSRDCAGQLVSIRAEAGKEARRSRPCAHCSKPIGSLAKKLKYCGSDCYHASTRQRAAFITCLMCGKEFEPSSPKIVLCSKKCVGKLCAARSIEKNTKPCAHCGKIFRASQSAVRFCSKRCGWDSKKKKKHPCHHCNKLDSVVIGRKYCSPKCAKESARTRRQCEKCGRSMKPGQETCYHGEGKEAATRPCLRCGTEFRARPSSKRKYCSTACYRGK